MSHTDFSTGSLNPSYFHDRLRDELGSKNVTTLSVKKGIFMVLLRNPSFCEADYLMVAAFRSRDSAISRHLPMTADEMTPQQTSNAAIVLHKWAHKRKRVVEILPEYGLIEAALKTDSDHVFCPGSASNARRLQRAQQLRQWRQDQRTEAQFDSDELNTCLDEIGSCFPAF